MFGYILCIYLIIGIITMVPYIYGGARYEGREQLDDEEIRSASFMLGVGLGAVWTIVIWPCWIAYIIYRTYFKN